MTTFNRTALDRIIKQTEGRICTISFIKDNGRSRTITGRVGVKYQGQTSSHRMDSPTRCFFLIYSMRDRGFRRIDAEAVVSIKCDGLYIFNTDLVHNPHKVA